MRARLTVETGECLPPVLDLAPGQPVTLGRGRDNTCIVRDALASRLHAKIYFEDGRWHVRDFGLNGTRLDGQKIAGGAELADGRKIMIGEVTLRFSMPLVLANDAPIAFFEPPPTVPIRRAGGESHQTKIHELPVSRKNADPPPEESAKQRRMDELTALCKFMAAAVETKAANDLIALALRSILHQTTARLAGYLSFDPDDPTPKIVMPETEAVDPPLSRRLTQQ
ncbi:MAG TPA: FHA domain-containing protein, partial [Urbifossiella sp.]